MTNHRSKSKLTPQALFDYAESFATAAEKAGRGTQFPTFRQAAAYFRVRIGAIEEAIEEWTGDAYMQAAVGLGGRGGYFLFSTRMSPGPL